MKVRTCQKCGRYRYIKDSGLCRDCLASNLDYSISYNPSRLSKTDCPIMLSVGNQGSGMKTSNRAEILKLSESDNKTTTCIVDTSGSYSDVFRKIAKKQETRESHGVDYTSRISDRIEYHTISGSNSSYNSKRLLLTLESILARKESTNLYLYIDDVEDLLSLSVGSDLLHQNILRIRELVDNSRGVVLSGSLENSLPSIGYLRSSFGDDLSFRIHKISDDKIGYLDDITSFSEKDIRFVQELDTGLSSNYDRSEVMLRQKEQEGLSKHLACVGNDLP